MYSFVGGGFGSGAWGMTSVVVGGDRNAAFGQGSFVGGGFRDSAFGLYSTIGGGANNTASGAYATVPGGRSLTASGDRSVAMGSYASTNGNAGSFVYGDASVNTVLNSSGANRFEVRAQNIWFGTTNTVTYPAGAYLATSTGAYLTAGGTWTNSSDVNRKTDFRAIDPRTVLEGIAELPVSAWRYRAEGTDVLHIGPTAQDFHAAFGLNGTDSTHIATVDADGVALAAIKALYELIREKDAQIAELRARLEKLEEK